MDVNQTRAQDTEAAAKPAPSPDRTADVEEMIAALVRLLARQAAREHLQRLPHPDAGDATDEE